MKNCFEKKKWMDFIDFVIKRPYRDQEWDAIRKGNIIYVGDEGTKRLEAFLTELEKKLLALGEEASSK